MDYSKNLPSKSQPGSFVQAANNQNMSGTPNVLPPSAQNSGAFTPTAFAAGAVSNRTPFNSGAGVITLSATGTGANVKMQSADDTVESVGGTLGAASFTVDQLPDRATLGYGGGTLLGIDVLRKFLLMYAIFVEYIQYEGGSTGQLANPIKILSASPFGSSNTNTITPSQFSTNMQQSTTLVDIRQGNGFLFAGNTAIQVLVANAITIKMSWKNCSIVPYNAAF